MMKNGTYYIGVEDLKQNGARDCLVLESKPEYDHLTLIVDDTADAYRGRCTIMYNDGEVSEHMREVLTGTAAPSADWFGSAKDPTIGLFERARRYLL